MSLTKWLNPLIAVFYACLRTTANLTPRNWEKAIEHVQKEEEKMWRTDHLMERAVEPIIINLGDDSDLSDTVSE